MQFLRFKTVFFLLTVCFSNLYAQNNTKANGTQDSLRVFQMPQIEIISKRDGIFGKLPGSADYLNEVQLQRLAPLTGNEILRKVTGVHVVDEEGAGLRMNLGIRGLDPDRSRGVLVLEDGIPVALNPYGEPEMYYTPSIDRMAGIEVVKGSGQILFGPQTIGGVINYITQDPSEKSQTKLRVIGGQKGFFSGSLGYGNTFGNTGVQVNFLRRQADQLGYANYQINDFSAKIKFTLSNKSSLGLKLGVYDETSNSTYIGLTQTMFDKGNQDFTLMAPDDRLTIRRYSMSLTHKHEFNKKLTLQTSVFAYTTTRNWQRQDFSSSATASNRTGVVWGDPSVPNGAVYMRNSTGSRNRQFEVLGVEPRLTYKFALGQKQAELQAGMRYLYERAFEQRVNGKKYNASAGDMVEDEVRTGKAFSIFAQQQVSLSQKLGITAGIRFEQYGYERQIFRNTFRIRNANVLVDTNLVANNNIQALIVGAGVNYNFSENMTIFGGVHRGFAPPRVKDAISNLGEVYQLEAEQSWNYEVGTRGKIKNVLNYELTAFYMDFDNQIIPVSESSGGTGAGLVNGGRTLHQGLEMGLGFDFAKLFSPEYLLRWQVNATYVDARYTADRFLGEKNIKGNRTPYAPPFFVSNTLNFEMPFGFGANLTTTHVSKQFGDERNTSTAAADGRTGEIPAYQILDANIYYRNTKRNFAFNLAVKNLSNERYIATRRPQGIRVGLPRFVTAGFEITF